MWMTDPIATIEVGHRLLYEVDTTRQKRREGSGGAQRLEAIVQPRQGLRVLDTRLRRSVQIVKTDLGRDAPGILVIRRRGAGVNDRGVQATGPTPQHRFQLVHQIPDVPWVVG